MLTINELPVELLLSIFLDCLTKSVFIRVPLDLNQPPWTLSRVCSKWRSVILSTPELWSYIQIQLVPTTSRSFQKHEEKVKNILARSGSALLFLSLTSFYNVFNPDEIRALVPHLSRLRELDIVGVPGDFFSYLPTSLPFLERVSVSRIFGFGTSTFSLEEAPKLRVATFTTCSLSSLPFMFPLSQIATMTFPNLSLHPVDVLRLLVQCKSLAECCLHINNPVRPSNPAIVEQNRLNLPHTHTLPFLTFFRLELEWNFDDELDLTDFQILSLPRLSHFELDGTARSMDWFRAIASTVWRMETLKLSSFRGEAGDEIRLVLESIPTLRTLRGVDHTTSHKVIRTRGLFDLLPNLEALHLPFPPNAGPLDLRMANRTGDELEQRRAESSLASPPRLVFHATDRLSVVPLPLLERMRKAGWEIDIVTQSSD